jgi:hypothetical protein
VQAVSQRTRPDADIVLPGNKPAPESSEGSVKVDQAIALADLAPAELDARAAAAVSNGVR